MAHRVAPASLRVAPLLALALLAAGCGKSKERELYEQREAACASVLGLTVSQANAALPGNLNDVDCATALNRVDETDTCGGSTSGPYTEVVCRVFFLWGANDPGLCNDSTGCVYGCVVRVTPGDATTLDDVAICQRSWLP